MGGGGGGRLHWRVQRITSSPTEVGSRRRVVTCFKRAIPFIFNNGPVTSGTGKQKKEGRGRVGGGMREIEASALAGTREYKQSDRGL